MNGYSGGLTYKPHSGTIQLDLFILQADFRTREARSRTETPAGLALLAAALEAHLASVGAFAAIGYMP